MDKRVDSSVPTIALVRAAMDRRINWKDVVRALADRPPDEDSAKPVIAAYEDGSCPPWLATYLLGSIRHPIG